MTFLFTIYETKSSFWCVFNIVFYYRYDTEEREAESDEDWDDEEEDGLEAVYKDNLEVSC